MRGVFATGPACELVRSPRGLGGGLVRALFEDDHRPVLAAGGRLPLHDTLRGSLVRAVIAAQ